MTASTGCCVLLAALLGNPAPTSQPAAGGWVEGLVRRVWAGVGREAKGGVEARGTQGAVEADDTKGAVEARGDETAAETAPLARTAPLAKAAPLAGTSPLAGTASLGQTTTAPLAHTTTAPVAEAETGQHAQTGTATQDRTTAAPTEAAPHARTTTPDWSAALSPVTLSLISALAVAAVPLGLAMLSSYIRISVVLALLRTGLATPGVPPVSVQAGLAVILTAVTMAPVLDAVWTRAGEPLLAGRALPADAGPAAVEPVRQFMIRQIDATGQHAKVRLFTDRAGLPAPTTWNDVPTRCLVPGYCLAELHNAFAIGVRLLVPFLVLDLIVAAVLVSLGLFLVPPTLVSLPLKLILFVAADGWSLVVGQLLRGFA